MGRSPVVIRQIVRRRGGAGGGEDGDGFECCGFCRVCTCLRWSFLTTPTGVVKSIELVFKLSLNSQSQSTEETLVWS